MNRKQQKVLIIGGVLLAVLVLFPPWVQTVTGVSARSLVAIGYHPIYEPPQPKAGSAAYGVEVDSARWTAELVVTGLLTGIAFFLFKDVKGS